MEEYGPREKTLRAAAAAATAASREGNPKKLRGAETSSSGDYLLHTYFSISPFYLHLPNIYLLLPLLATFPVLPTHLGSTHSG